MGNSTSYSEGLRIITVEPGSPAARANLHPFEDYILDIAPSPLNFSLFKDFQRYVYLNENKEISVLVANLGTKKARKVTMIPSKNWKNSKNLLGLRYRKERIEDGETSILRISKVMVGGPAFKAEIESSSNFILGALQFPYSSIEEFGQKVAMFHRGESNPYIDLYILNGKTYERRVVRIHPSSNWGGNGLLGMELQTGILDSTLALSYSSKTLGMLKREESVDDEERIENRDRDDGGSLNLDNREEGKLDKIEKELTKISLKEEKEKEVVTRKSVAKDNGRIQEAVELKHDLIYFSAHDEDNNKYIIKGSYLLPSLRFNQRFYTFSLNK